MLKMCPKPGTKTCRNPGSNRGPLDLQSNALPTELFRPEGKSTRGRGKSEGARADSGEWHDSSSFSIPGRFISSWVQINMGAN